MNEQTTDLVVLSKLVPAVLFAPGGSDDVLERIRREVRSFHADISTKAGREAVASLAYKVARSKTALDDLGKDLVSEFKAKSSAVDAERRKIREELDALKDEVRKPLTDWENAEKARLAGHEDAIAALALAARLEIDMNADAIAGRLESLGTLAQRDWQEFATRADATLNNTRSSLNAALADARKREDEAAELARLRAEQAEREKREREERIAAEAADRARREAEEKAEKERKQAEAKAAAERERIEMEKRDAEERAAAAERKAKQDAERAERERVAAEARAKQEREAAVKAERERQDRERREAEAAAQKREADKKHRAKINNEALAALQTAGLSNEQGTAVITAIARGEIPHIKIAY